MNAPTTPTPSLDDRLAALDAKLEQVLVEVEEVRRLRRGLEDLQDDLVRVARDAWSSTIMEMEEIAPFVKTGDFSDLFKRLLRNTNNINELLVQLESARALADDATPLVRRLFHDSLEQLDQLEQRGYFSKGRELARALDNVVAEFSVEEVRQLADNITTILHTVKNLTQPEMLEAVDNAVEIYRKIDFQTVEEYSPFKAFREINKPEMRRGIGFLIVFLRNLSAHQPPSR